MDDETEPVIEEGQDLPDPNLLVYRNPEGNKLYTHRYIQKVKSRHRDQLRRIVLKSDYVARVVSDTVFEKAQQFLKESLASIQKLFNEEA